MLVKELKMQRLAGIFINFIFKLFNYVSSITNFHQKQCQNLQITICILINGVFKMFILGNSILINKSLYYNLLLMYIRLNEIGEKFLLNIAKEKAKGKRIKIILRQIYTDVELRYFIFQCAVTFLEKGKSFIYCLK